jgi:hypothetical protein
MKEKFKHRIPGQKWELSYLDVAEAEGRKILTEAQYAHIVGLFDELATENDPRNSSSQDVKAIDEFYELRDKGGVLGKINMRTFFAVLGKTIVVLGNYKKEDEGQTPGHVKIKIRNRLRQVEIRERFL